MRRIVSLLVALALILSLSATAFAVTGGFQDDPVVIETLEGGFEMTAGNTWMDADVYFKYVAEKAGTIQTDAASGVWFSVNDPYGFTWAGNGESSVAVAAGDVLYINFSNTTPNVINANLFYEGEEPSGGNGGNDEGGNVGESIPNGGALALGSNNVTLNYATMPMMAAKWTYTATESGFLTVTVDSINGNNMLAMAFGRGMYTLFAGESDGMGSNTVTVFANAGDVINIAVTDTMDFDPVPAVLTLSFVAGEPVVEKNPADYFEKADNGDYILGSLTEAVEIFVGNDDIYFTYTAEADGTLALTATVDGYAGTNTAIKINNGDWAYNAYSAEVVAGDIVRINIWQGFEGTAILLTDGGAGDSGDDGNGDGGNVPEGIPSGSALALGNNDVVLTYAMMPMMAPYWTYTATENGYLTVTVDSINGNGMLGMPFGMGIYTLYVGETTGMGANTVTVYLNAGETVNVAVTDTMDMEPVAAVINVTFVAGEPVVEKNPADYFEKNENDNYVIPSLAENVEIFVGNDDIYFVYTAEANGVVSLTATVEGFEATNCAIRVNEGDWDWAAAPAAVSAGDVVMINIWGGYEGVVSLTGGEGGDEVESAPMSGENVAVEADKSIVVYYTPITNGTLSVDIAANPGFSITVQNVATEDTVGLPKQSSLAQVVTYELEAGVEYMITMTGYDTAAWDVAAATITYNITFESGNGSSEPVNIDESTVALVLGEQNVDLLENTIVSLFGFIPAEAGVYTFTVPTGVTIAQYGIAWNVIQTAEGTTLEVTATAAEQAILVGLSGDVASVNVKVEKTGAYTPPAETTYVDYEATVEFDEEFKMPEGDVTSVDITAAQTVVLGADGYYHLGTADGPILYVNLNSASFTLATLLDAGAPITMRGEKYTGEDGKLYCYDYMNMIAFGDYYNYSHECDYYPLNADLMAFFQDYGAAQGWYDKEFSNFEEIKTSEFNADSAWMVALVYIADDANQGGNTGSNDKTGDFGVIAAVVALATSAIGGTAVIAKKKEN